MTTVEALAQFDVTAWPHAEVPCNLCGRGSVRVIATEDRYHLPTRIVQCEDCGLRFISPRMSAEGYAAFYAHGYRPLVQGLRESDNRIPKGSMVGDQQRYAMQLSTHVWPFVKPHGHMLDIGGSTGAVSRYLRCILPGTRITVIDPSPTELEQARKDHCDTICAAAETVTFPPATIALLCRTIDHLLDPIGVLQRIYDAAPVLVVDIMNVDAWPLQYRYKVDHPYAFTEETLLAMLRATGWIVRRRWDTRQGKYIGIVATRQES